MDKHLSFVRIFQGKGSHRPPVASHRDGRRDGGEILSGFAFAHASPVVKSRREKRGSLSCLTLPKYPSAN